MIISEVTKNIALDTLFTDQFRYSSGRKLFVANKSGLGNSDLFRNTYQNDMSTVGFKLRSTRTNQVKTFYLSKTNKIGDRIDSWIFTDEAGSGLTVKVMNA
jgi:hypothetical protein